MLDTVAAGQTVRIVRDGQPVADVVPPMPPPGSPTSPKSKPPDPGTSRPGPGSRGVASQLEDPIVDGIPDI
jgi:antitoxin (DNA-binding transcriptional repressor) of toxin-antitoxin stability system